MSEASEETRVGIKAAFPVKKRELNGLNRVAAFMNDNRAERIPVVGMVEFTKHTETVDGDEMTVALVVVEPVVDAQGRSVKGYAEAVRRMIEDMRRSAGKAPVADTLFDGKQEKQLDAELDGQIALVETPEQSAAIVDENLRSKGGEGLVPEKSGEELAAERAEGVPAADQTVTDETPGQKAFKADVVAAVTGAGGRKPRGATVRPTADPFTPTDAA